MTLKDKQILINEGEKTYSFNTCFVEMFPALCSFAEKYLDDGELAKDIVQDIFTKLWDRFEEFDSDIRIKTYLYRSIRNTSINHLKHLKVEDKYNKRRSDELDSEKSFLSDILEKETHRIIYQAIEELPEKQKEIVYKSIWGLSNAEIAEEMHVSINTIKTQKARAYKQLRHKLQNIYSVLNLLLLN